MIVLSRVMYVVDNYSVYKRYGSEFDPREDDVMSYFIHFPHRTHNVLNLC